MIKIKGKKAFTLIEVLIALAISSFIMVSMFSIYQNMVGSINRTREIMILNRKVCLLFDQIEKDLSAAFIPKLHEEEKIKKQEDDKKEEGKKEEEKKKINFFSGEIYEGQGRRIEGKRWEFFKNVNFITTNPLEIYGQKRVRLVRVMYELEKDKQKSTRDKTSYVLFRKETQDLENIKFKELEEGINREEKHAIRKYLVADNIKELFVEYVTIREKKEKERRTFFDTGKRVDQEQVRSFVWGLQEEAKKKEKEKKKGQEVPSFILVKIVFWDDELVDQHSFEDMIPIPTFPTLIEDGEKEDKKKDEEKKTTPQEKGEKAGKAVVQPPAGPARLGIRAPVSRGIRGAS